MKNNVIIRTCRPVGQKDRFGDPDARQRDGRDARCDYCRSADPAPDARPRACGCPIGREYDPCSAGTCSHACGCVSST